MSTYIYLERIFTMNRNISHIQSKIRVLKLATRIQRKANTLTPMERVIQRIATKKLIIAIDESVFQSASMMFSYQLFAGLMGISAQQAFQDKSVGALFSKFANEFNFIPLLKSQLRGLKRLTSEQKEDLFQNMALKDDGAGSPAYDAGKIIANKYNLASGGIQKVIDFLSISRAEIKAEKDPKKRKKLKEMRERGEINPSSQGEIFKLVKTAIINDVKDYLKSHGFQLSQETMQMEQGAITRFLEESQLDDDEYEVDDDLMDDNLNFVTNIFNGGRALSQKIRDIAHPFLAKELRPNWDHAKVLWLKDFAEDKIFGPDGLLLVPTKVMPQYNALFELNQWLGTKDGNYFKKKMKKTKGNHQFEITGTKNELFIYTTVKEIGSPLGTANKADYYIQFGNSPVLKGYVNSKKGKDLVIFVPGGARYTPKKKKGDKVWAGTLGPMSVVPLKAAAMMLQDKMRKLVEGVQKIYLHNEELRKALFAALLTEQVFRRSLQAKKKEQKKLARHINVPF